MNPFKVRVLFIITIQGDIMNKLELIAMLKKK
jgi:hypothetical protein